jgi:hypothetical protein
MSETNLNFNPALAGAVSLSTANGAPTQTRSPMEAWRSFTAELRRPLRRVISRFNGHSHDLSDRRPLVRPTPPDLSSIDSKELLREILRRVGDDPECANRKAK